MKFSVHTTGKLLLATRRGAPFIADLRVQWIRIARQDHGSSQAKLPTTIHLLGDIDDIVSREDSQDLAAAKDARFITLLNTDHQDIVTDLETNVSLPNVQIMNALCLREEELELSFDKVQEEDLNIKRIIYILHGIRDYGTWAERLRSVLEKELEGQGLNEVAVTPPKYGYFPMAPFILYWDRQRNVRKFMDEYTENIARYPNAEDFDFIGHSNGTYILASALQRYPTLKVRNVLFAGSVVPKGYRWRELVDAGRVSKVRNVVATGDWVVAIFPRFFEQIAESLHIDSVNKGILDIGSAGFRGFDDSAKVDRARSICDTKFVSGMHSAALDIWDERKRSAIVAFAIHGRDEGIIGLKNADEPWGWLDHVSNMSVGVWLFLAILFVCLPFYLALNFFDLKYFGIYMAFLVMMLFFF